MLQGLKIKPLFAPKEEEAGPTNNWMDPSEMKGILKGFYRMYEGKNNVCNQHGAPWLKISYIGVELTDSPTL
jgi:phosphoenolpyruvate carboxykinase (GTP)